MSTILFVNGDREVCDAAQSYLTAKGHHAAIVSSGAAAMRVLTTFCADLVVWDTNVSDTAADEFCRWLLTNPSWQNLPMLFIVPAGHPGINIFPSCRQGGRQKVRHTVIRKPFQWDDLAIAVQRLITSVSDSSAVLSIGNLKLDTQNYTLMLYGQRISLTTTEFRLSLYLAQVAGKVVPVEELLEHVWGFYPGTGSRELVRQHVRNIRHKLSRIEGGRDLITTLPRRGYRLVPPD